MSTETARIIRDRRSIKKFTPRPVTRSEIEALLDLAVTAPNHRMTQPWGFIVLGPAAKREYGEIKGRNRALRVEDAEAARLVVQKTVESLIAVPAIVAFTQRISGDAEVQDEDFATIYMGIQNFLIGAVASGLGTHVRTGALLNEPETRAALGIPDGERVVALVELGEPEEIPAEKARVAASARTRWLS